MTDGTCEDRLAALPNEEFEGIVRDRLHGLRSVGPPIDRRVGPEPYEWLAELYEGSEAGSVLRWRMTAVMSRFLHDEVVRGRTKTPWPEEARVNLLDLIQRAGDGLVSEIVDLLTIRHLSDYDRVEADVRAGLLKSLINLGHHCDRSFWMTQSVVLGSRYGALIFSGLLQLGLEQAAVDLPRLVGRDDEAITQVRLGLPMLKELYGEDRVRAAFRSQFDKFTSAAREAFGKDLDIRTGTDAARRAPIAEPVEVDTPAPAAAGMF